MKSFAGFAIIAALVVALADGVTYTFPESFKIGAASASYQIEGAWNEDGKSPNVWDTLVHNNPGYVLDWTNADVAANSYHFWQKDIDALQNIGFEVYRFSISWSRIVPNGASGRPNQAGIDYYNRLIDGLLAIGIEPLVTIFHWDLPQYLQDLGGWTNPLMVEYFKEYADVLYANFGDRVKNWITFNEPSVFCGEGYGYTTKAPAIESPGVGDYLCVHHVLLSHAAAYHLYKDKYSQQNGQIGICLNSGFSYPGDTSVDPSYAEKALEFELGRYSTPIYSEEGGYPQIVIDQIGNKSQAEGRRRSRFPNFTDAQREYVRGTADFLALNYYSSRLVEPRPEVPSFPINWWSDTQLNSFVDDSWPRAKSEWLYSAPQGLQDLLVWIKNKYNNPTVMITENGWSDDGQIEDNDRVTYIKAHLASVSRAISDDSCNVVAYTVWSLTDNFEWKVGYTERFGIHYINFNSEDKERVPKTSALFFKDLMPTKSFEIEEN